MAVAKPNGQRIDRWNGRGKPKSEWCLKLTIGHESGEETEEFEVRAANKQEAANKAYQRVQAYLDKLVLEDCQNPRLYGKLSRQNGNGGKPAFILQSSCRHYAAALRARGPSQMFKEVNGGGKKHYN